MPGLVKKILIFAAIDGLFLHPVGSGDRTGILISYGNGSRIKSADRNQDYDDTATLEAYGIVGILNLVSRSYLISITKKQEVAQIQGRRIFEIKDVTLVPLTTQSEAQATIKSHHKSLREDSSRNEHGNDLASDSDAGYESDNSVNSDHAAETAALEAPPPKELTKRASVLKGVVQDKGKYGRFAEKWFSKGGWTAAQRRRLGMTEGGTGEELADWSSGSRKPQISEDLQDMATPQNGLDDKAVAANNAKGSIMQSLVPRIVRTTRLYFSSGGFYFSYEHDLSNTLSTTGNSGSQSALHKRFRTAYFWNRHLITPFVAAGKDEYAIPLLQGFVGQRKFSISKHNGIITENVTEAYNDNENMSSPATSQAQEQQPREFLLTLVSRRSTHRAGLRYLRRGIDDEGFVANNVETEQILSPAEATTKASSYSLVQIRGSMPLFFSQSPYSFKPIPHQFRSQEANTAAFRKHFEAVAARYGNVQVASLVDKHGTEASIGQSYEKYTNDLNENGGIHNSQLGFEWFDFHSICKGMNFGKVQILVDSLQQQLNSFGYTIRNNQDILRQQSGVLRTNCMDCLDRTNVVQSAVGSWALQQQLAGLGLSIDLKNDPSTQWFNTLWADNGDNISKQYAGTAALKGDFTRTRQRKWTGALSDFSLTLTRYYNNIFGDYFLQTCIDYYLGNTTAVSFDEFATDMITQDLTLDMGQIRQKAIDTSVKIALESPTETFIAGHILACPRERNTLRSLPFEECVLLLTNAALYHVRFDWDAEKVSSFERVDLCDIEQVWRGAYITSTLAESYTDKQHNYGFAIKYKSATGVLRANTRSLTSEQPAAQGDTTATSASGAQSTATPSKQESNLQLLAFKALPSRSSVSRGDAPKEQFSEVNMIKHICDELSSLIEAKMQDPDHFEPKTDTDTDTDTDTLGLSSTTTRPVVWERDVISLTEARRSTGYVESLSYSLKKLVWS